MCDEKRVPVLRRPTVRRRERTAREVRVVKAPGIRCEKKKCVAEESSKR